MRLNEPHGYRGPEARLVSATPSFATAAFDPAFFAELARVEDRHFWFRARNRLIEGLARRLASRLSPGYRVLELGCGDGNVLRYLARACSEGLTIGMDFFDEGLLLARQRSGCPLVRGDARCSPFARRFHVIGMFDVLEHLSDDLRMLADVAALLEPGGWLLLTVPARRSLWSYFDEASHHFRRYEKQELTDKLRDSGFEIQQISHFMCSIYPLLWMTRRWRKRTSGAPQEAPEMLARREFKIFPVINEMIAAPLWLEAIWVSRGNSLPFGTSLVAVARRAPGAA
jgi:SAM-dependent methyltransferase